jgi:2-C-methyl-D-erythritol 2,4-cyclodiphosphate synthase
VTRVGWGVDAHRFAGSGRVLLGGVEVDDTRGVEATSDGDVVAHALADAILAGAALGDLGSHFPSSDPRWRDADSMDLLRRVVAILSGAGFAVTSVDVTVIAQSVRVAPHRDAIRTALAAALGVAVDAVSVKATTTDGMGFTGRDEGIAAMAVAVVGRSGVGSRESV